MTRPPAVRDVVAILIVVEAHDLVRGQVGTVVERLADDYFEVEFSDDQGRTYAQLPVHRDALLVLHHRPTQALSVTTASSESSGQDSAARDAASLDALFGRWPGDETDEDLAAALAASR